MDVIAVAVLRIRIVVISDDGLGNYWGGDFSHSWGSIGVTVRGDSWVRMDSDGGGASQEGGEDNKLNERKPQ